MKLATAGISKMDYDVIDQIGMLDPQIPGRTPHRTDHGPDAPPQVGQTLLAGPARQSQSLTGAKLRVLLAEDDILLAATISEFLTADGFTVIAKPDGQAALEAALADIDGFDVLLTDLRMPQLDGTSLLLALRARRPTLPVVVMSGNVPSNWHETIQQGLPGQRLPTLVTKPMRLGELCAAVWDACIGEPGVNEPGASEQGSERLPAGQD